MADLVHGYVHIQGWCGFQIKRRHDELPALLYGLPGLGALDLILCINNIFQNEYRV